MITLLRAHVEEMLSHARATEPLECCGLIGGTHERRAQTVYPLRNVARDARVAYEAAPEELFAAQRDMRLRGEQMLAIYHSHPRASRPLPSEKDVRLAYYPAAVYFIIALSGKDAAALGAFRLSEREGRWEEVGYEVADA